VREEAQEDGRKGREKKERLKADSESNGHHFNNLLDICTVEMMSIAFRTNFQPIFFSLLFLPSSSASSRTYKY
jgi:hypothetical protein